MPFRTLHTAEVLLPMGSLAPITNAGVVVDDAGVILEVGPLDTISSGADARHNHGVLLPGVLNCHVHLTDARRAWPVPGGAGLNQWVRELLSVRGADDAAGSGITSGITLDAAVLAALDAMRASGTVAVGEVANNLSTLDAIGRSGMRCRFIHELIGFRGDRASDILQRALDQQRAAVWPPNVHPTLGAHAPYSVSPELFRLIEEWTATSGLFFHQHLAEDPDERLLYEHGRGPWRDYLEHVGAWDEGWSPSGGAPIQCYDDIGLLNNRFIAVHLADATADEITLLAGRGVRAILSPSSNLHITGTLPPFEAIVASGMPFAFGTDGRGSNGSLDVFSEARCLFERWPDLRPGIFLEGLTRTGAEILQFDDLGAIRPGACPGLMAVDIDAPGTGIAALERQIVMSAPEHRRLVSVPLPESIL